jgi:hypothetical protein
MLKWVAGALVVVLLGATLVLIHTRQQRQRELESIDDPSALDDLHLHLPQLDTTEWIERWQPDLAYNGVTLVLYQRRVPMLIDMAGRIVHVWPHVRVIDRMRLDREGRLLVTGTDGLLKVYDWDGRLEWCYRLPGEEDFPHHDLIWTERGNVLLIARDWQERSDYLQEVSRSGKVVWEWRADDHLDSAFPRWNREAKDPTHINSIRELPANRWFDRGDDRFRPGNLLVSARNLNTVFIIDKRSGEVVWQYCDRLDYQHEAVMIPPGRPGAGLVLLFNNGLKNLYAYRKSSVVAVNPMNEDVVWSYSDRLFFSAIAGTQQSLPNGNLLIVSSHGGRVFEITPDGEIVWQWIPPYLPMRPERYASDHCPQLAALAQPGGDPIPSRLGHRFVDRELRSFAVSGEYTVKHVEGIKRQIVRSGIECRQQIIPPGAIINLNYGLDRERLGQAEVSARFRFTLRSPGGARTEVIHEDVVGSDAERTWRGTWIRLKWRPYQSVDLCLDIEVEGGVTPTRARKIAVIDNPRIHTTDTPRLPADLLNRKLTEQERTLQEKQLKALGYVN